MYNAIIIQFELFLTVNKWYDFSFIIVFMYSDFNCEYWSFMSMTDGVCCVYPLMEVPLKPGREPFCPDNVFSLPNPALFALCP